MGMPFIPRWAEKELSKSAITGEDLAELHLLRNFYRRWVWLHQIPNDKLHRREQEIAAEQLTAAANAVKQLHG